MMFMMFHAPKQQRSRLIAFFGATAAIGAALWVIF